MAEGMAGMFEGMAKAFEGIAQAGKGMPVVVHPQISKTNEEARELGKDWSKRETKQLQDNLSSAFKRRK